MLSLEEYAIAKDQCCIGYFGPDKKIMRELIAARPVIERLLPGIKVYVSCRAEYIDPSAEMMIASTDLKVRRHDFAYFLEIRSDGFASPVKKLLEGIQLSKISV